MTSKNHQRNWTPEQRREGLRSFTEETYQSQHDKPLSTPEEMAAINADFDRPLTEEELKGLVEEVDKTDESRRKNR